MAPMKSTHSHLSHALLRCAGPKTKGAESQRLKATFGGGMEGPEAEVDF